MTEARLFDWECHPDAEAFVQAQITAHTTPVVARVADAMMTRAAVRLRDVVDHFRFDDDALARQLESLGWHDAGDGVYRHARGHFPAFVRRSGARAMLVRCEAVETFVAAHAPGTTIEGPRFGPARRALIAQNEGVAFGAIERNGFAGFDIPDTDPALIRTARLHGQIFRARRRQFDTVEQGLAVTEALVDAAVAAIGAHWACDLWLKAERDYWMARCAAARLQKARQDAAGIGWANIDHHTYDGSRAHFRRTIRILKKLGYELREMLYAGELAGWGSQVLEQPVIRSTIFADVDLAPEEVDVDFAHQLLPPLAKHRRAGMVSALHGESILEAGLNHVAGLYDQRALRAQLDAEGVAMMAPFSSFSHLYQELTLGDFAPVDPARVDALVRGGHLSEEEAETIRLEGAILTHLENIERNEGYKGFNKPGIDGVLRKLDPRHYEDAVAS